MKKYRAFAVLLIFLFFASGCINGNKEKNGAHEEHEENHKETKSIILTKEQMDTAGIRTAKVQYQPIKERIGITGELVAVPMLEVRITSRVAGKIMKLLVQEGDHVDKGTPLAIIESVEMAEADASFHRAETELETAKKNLLRIKDMAKLGIFSKSALEDALNTSAEAKASLESASANLILEQKQYDRIKDLQSSGIASLKDLEKSEADLKKAVADQNSAKVKLESSLSRYNREELNFKRGHLTYKEVYEAENRYREALSHYRSALNSMKIMGVSESNHGSSMTVSSPIAGIITTLQITPGEAVVPTTPIMTVVNPKKLWLMADIYDKDLNRVKVGNKVYFYVSSYPDRQFIGHVSYIRPFMNETTRTVKARIEVPNDTSLLKINMFAKGFILNDTGKKGLLLPSGAIQNIDGNSVVYIENDKAGEFVSQIVTKGKAYGDLVEIIDGITPDSTCVIKGSFTLKSEEKKAAMGEGDGCGGH